MERVRFFSNSGDRFKKTYSLRVDEDGVLGLVETGKDDLYAEIQSHADSVDIDLLINRYINGDASALSNRFGSYGDFTDIPNNYAAVLNTLMKAEEYFNSLNPGVRSNFNNSFSQFIASLGSDAFLQKLGIVKASEIKPEPKPKADEGINGSAE